MVERFGPDADTVVPGEGVAGGRPVRVTNPLSSQHSVMRQSLVGSLLEVVATNLRQGREDVAIFEVGKGYGVTDEATMEALEELQRVTFGYFLKETNPANGLVPDNTRKDSPCSITAARPSENGFTASNAPGSVVPSSFMNTTGPSFLFIRSRRLIRACAS